MNEDAAGGSDAKMRASCYIAIGKLGLKVPQLVNKDVTVIQVFFGYRGPMGYCEGAGQMVNGQ